MLLDGSRADFQLRRNFLVAATLNQQVQNLVVPGCDLDFTQICHSYLSLGDSFVWLISALSDASAKCNSFAKVSPIAQKDKDHLDALSCGSTEGGIGHSFKPMRDETFHNGIVLKIRVHLVEG